MNHLLIIATSGAITALDTTVLGQFMISQPIVASTITGYFLGYPEIGMLFGIFMQLLWLKLIPTGGSIYLNGNLGALTSISLYSLLHSTFGTQNESLFFICLISGIASSYIFGYMTYYHRLSNLPFIRLSHVFVNEGKLTAFQLLHLSGVLIKALLGAVSIVGVVFLFQQIILMLPLYLFEALNVYAVIGKYSILGTGFGIAFSIVWHNQGYKLSAIGVLVGLIIIIFRV